MISSPSPACASRADPEQRELLPARRAPAGPEVDDHWPAGVVGKVDSPAAVERRQGQRRRRLVDERRATDHDRRRPIQLIPGDPADRQRGDERDRRAPAAAGCGGSRRCGGGRWRWRLWPSGTTAWPGFGDCLDRPVHVRVDDAQEVVVAGAEVGHLVGDVGDARRFARRRSRSSRDQARWRSRRCAARRRCCCGRRARTAARRARSASWCRTRLRCWLRSPAWRARPPASGWPAPGARPAMKLPIAGRPAMTHADHDHPEIDPAPAAAARPSRGSRVRGTAWPTASVELYSRPASSNQPAAAMIAEHDATDDQCRAEDHAVEHDHHRDRREERPRAGTGQVHAGRRLARTGTAITPVPPPVPTLAAPVQAQQLSTCRQSAQRPPSCLRQVPAACVGQGSSCCHSRIASRSQPTKATSVRIDGQHDQQCAPGRTRHPADRRKDDDQDDHGHRQCRNRYKA